MREEPVFLDPDREKDFVAASDASIISIASRVSVNAAYAASLSFSAAYSAEAAKTS